MRAESRSRRLDATFLPSEVTKSFLRTHSARPRVDVKSATIGSKRTVDIEVGCSFLASARLGSMSACGTKRTSGDVRLESASLSGRLGSSAFRPSTTTVSTSLAGSCFSSESAPRPFHHGIRVRGGTIFRAALPSIERQVQADIRPHLIHRPARDIFPPLGGTRVFSYRV